MPLGIGDGWVDPLHQYHSYGDVSAILINQKLIKGVSIHSSLPMHKD